MTTLILLLVIGYILIIAEMMLPGGVLGILGVLCLIGAAIWAFMEFDATTGFLIVLLEVLSGAVLIFLWVKYFFDSPFGRRLVLGAEKGKGNAENSSAPDAPGAAAEWIGRKGTAQTLLRPSGTALIDGKRIDVLTEGELIDAGTPITVVKIEGTHIFVRRDPQTQPSTPQP